MEKLESVTVDAQCIFCQKETSVEFRLADYLDWQSGELIQNAMPYLSAAERELLISKICGDCFDDIFKG